MCPVLMLHHCNYNSFIMRQYIVSLVILLFFFKSLSVIFGRLLFSINFRISLSSSTEIHIGILIAIALNLLNNLEENLILIENFKFHFCTNLFSITFQIYFLCNIFLLSVISFLLSIYLICSASAFLSSFSFLPSFVSFFFVS